MSGIIELNEKLTEFGTAFEQFKTINDRRLEEITANGVVMQETLTSLGAVETSMTAIQKRIRELEADLAASAAEQQVQSDLTPEDRQHTECYMAWLRNPRDNIIQSEFQRAARVAEQIRMQKIAEKYKMAISIGTPTAGGNAVPTEIAARIQAKVREMSPIRRLATVVTASNENGKHVVLDTAGSGGWAGAGDTRSETDTDAVQAVTPTFGTCYAYPKVEEEAMNDIFFDVEGMVENQSGMILAQQEGTGFVSGNGTSKPTGFLNGTPVSTVDGASPPRAFGVLQYLPTGAAADFQLDRLGSPAGDPAGVLYDMVYALKAQHRRNAAWLANSTVIAKIRKWRDADGNYLYMPGLRAGEDDTLLGYRLEEGADMPDVAANAFPIAVADWEAGYLIADIVATLRITVDDNITAPGFVKFYVRRRVGGKVWNDDAIKLGKCATS